MRPEAARKPGAAGKLVILVGGTPRRYLGQQETLSQLD